MQWGLVVLFGVASTLPVRASDRQTKATAPKSTTSKASTPNSSKTAVAKPTSTAHPTTSHKGANTHVASASATHHSSTSARSIKSRRRSHPAASYQLHPDPERYQEIQKALADRGYFKGEANGEWGPDSVDALKRFQADQKLTDDGKINALSLTGLGLGPKYNSLSTPPATPPAQAPPSAPPPGSEPHAAAPPSPTQPPELEPPN